MGIDTSGALLEGIRISDGNNPFTFPPRSLVSSQASFASVSSRAEYLVIAACSNPDKAAVEIADPDLKFVWTKNEGSVTRFLYDGFSKRWMPSPGSAPNVLGPISNENRLIAPVPDVTVVNAPFDIYVGSPARAVTFKISPVGSQSSFTDPTVLPAGQLELSLADGKLNFSQADVSLYAEQPVISQRQSFFNRAYVTGVVGALPEFVTLDYFLFLNPRPAPGQAPRVRIGYGPLLQAVEVVNEAALGFPSPGTFHWSRDTGRVRVAPVDLSNSLGTKLYYDGVTVGSLQLIRANLASPPGPFPAVGLTVPAAVHATDPQRFILFAELPGQLRQYFNVALQNQVDTGGDPPDVGTVFLDTASGSVYLSPDDFDSFNGWSFFYIDSVIPVEHGVSVQFFRSGVNGSGPAHVSDFTVSYGVSGQIVVNGIIGFPFIMLPTTPVTDGSLSYGVEAAPGSSGTFIGNLPDGASPGSSGLSYLLNLDAHQLQFANRRTVKKTLLKATPSLKLADAAISQSGFEVKRNDVKITPGVDFDFDPSTGLIDFLKPAGENDPYNRSDISGGVVLPNVFTTDHYSFGEKDVGRYLLIQSGLNAGIYRIDYILNPGRITVSPGFIAPGLAAADLKAAAEVVIDRIWTGVHPSFKKFSLSVSDGHSSAFKSIPNSRFSVFANVGQVNLSAPARPGQMFRVAYVSLESPDNGVTVTPVNKVEMALFKIRRETAAVTAGSKEARFNDGGRTINTSRPIACSLEGVPLGPSDFTFQAPGTILLPNAINPGQSIVLSYWVEEALGGEMNFNLLSSTIDMDPPRVTEGQGFTTFNGDQTDVMSAGSPFLINNTDVLIAQSVSYDSDRDETDVVFESTPSTSAEGPSILVAESVSGTYRMSETSSVDTITQGTNFILVSGDTTASYGVGTVITVDGDPFLSMGSVFDPTISVTRITLASAAKKNYIIPSVTRTVRPIFFPGASFRTGKPAHAGLPFTLVKMGGERRSLVRDVDYSVSEGGVIQLSVDLKFGDSLFALYVARVFQPVGTKFSFNYAHLIAPDLSNGLIGQRLVSTYRLYAPDTFFYRIETVKTFIPEVIDLVKSSSSSGSSGPATQDATGPTNKDFGRPSPFFNEQNLANVDLVIVRLLKFYNDIVNAYEDILSNLDGRVVGGNQGRFRFDGNLDNPKRTNFDEVTNDIDDLVKLFDNLVITEIDVFAGKIVFEKVPVFGSMADLNGISRIFPTAQTKAAGLNDKTGTSDFGQPIGSLGVKNVKSIASVRSTEARSFFTKDVSSSSYLIPKNGDAKFLLPPFVAGQDVDVFTVDGILAGSGKVTAADTDEPATVVLNVAANVPDGSIMQNVSDSGNPKNHSYVSGRDLFVDPDSGQILNYNLPLFGPPNPAQGNEIVDIGLGFENQDLRPLRIPALDGLILNDEGRVSRPPLMRPNELLLLAKEPAAAAALGFAFVKPDRVTIFGFSIPVAVGEAIAFINGPNSGSVRSVVTSIPGIVTVSLPLPSADPAGSDLEVTSRPVTFSKLLPKEVATVSTNMAGGPLGPGSQLKLINSELVAAERAVAISGDAKASGTGLTSADTIFDPSAHFDLAGVSEGWLVQVLTGPNRGLYRVKTALANSITVDTVMPFSGFPAVAQTPYTVLRTVGFLSQRHAAFSTKFIRETLSFLGSTQAFLSSPSASTKLQRLITAESRSSSIGEFIAQAMGILANDNLYKMRYLFIDQRVNRQEGTRTRGNQAAAQRADAIQKTIDDQAKLLIVIEANS